MTNINNTQQVKNKNPHPNTMIHSIIHSLIPQLHSRYDSLHPLKKFSLMLGQKLVATCRIQLKLNCKGLIGARNHQTISSMKQSVVNFTMVIYYTH